MQQMRNPRYKKGRLFKVDVSVAVVLLLICITCKQQVLLQEKLTAAAAAGVLDAALELVAMVRATLISAFAAMGA